MIATTDTRAATLEALVASGWDLTVAASALGIKKDALRARIHRAGLKKEAVTTESTDGEPPSATHELARTEPTEPAAEAPKAVTKKVKVPASVVVMKGGTRIVRVAPDHPAAVALAVTRDLGGTTRATPTGLRLFDAEHRLFATVLTRKASADFYVVKVPVEVAENVAGALGTWTHTWPAAKRGSATLRYVEVVTATMIKELMDLATAYGTDRRRQKRHSA